MEDLKICMGIDFTLFQICLYRVTISQKTRWMVDILTQLYSAVDPRRISISIVHLSGAHALRT